MKKRILCFGDSLTWGWKPVEAGIPVERYAKNERWTGVFAEALGNDVEVIEEGLSGRTTDLDDPLEAGLNGSAYLPSAVASHLPLDLVVIMLGTNDTKVYFKRSALEIAAAIGKLIGQVAATAAATPTVYPAPRILLVAPPPLAPRIQPAWFADLFEGAREKSLALSQHLGNLASLTGIAYVNAGEHIATQGVDGIHFSQKNNLDLGKVLASFVRTQGLV